MSEAESIYLKPSTRSSKKYMVVIRSSERKKTIHFGDRESSDYTKHQDDKRKASYIRRHTKRENWTRSGLYTAGFWSRWILWNQITIKKSIIDINKKFNLTVKLQ